VDQLVEQFTQGASDWKALASMAVGGIAYRCANMSLLTSPLAKSLPFAAKIFSPVIALGAEVSVYQASLRLLHGEAFQSSSWSTDYVNFASLKIFGAAARNANFLLSNFIQDLGMVAGQRLAHGLGLAERPQGSFAEQMVHAQVTNLQLAAGMQLFHSLSAGRVQALEAGLELRAHAMEGRGPSLEAWRPLAPHPLESMSLVRAEDVRALSVRDYQEESARALAALPSQGRDRGLVVLPTGTGKTVMFSEFAGRFAKDFPDSNILVVTHREEIIDQNAKWLKRVFGEENVGIFQGDRRQMDRHVTVASIQSLLLSGADLSRFGLVVLDEAHHYVHGNEWFRPLQQMGFFDAEGNITHNAGKLLIGVTATPDRLSGKALNTTFGPDGLVYGRDITSFVGRRDPVTGDLYLLKPYGVEVNLLTGRGLDPAAAIRQAEATEKAQIIADMFEARLREGERFRRSVVFVSNKDEVIETARKLREKGVRVFELTDDVEAEPRKQGIAAYKAGDYDALVSIKIPTEGFDDPGTEAVVLGMATESRALLVQMAGRALRPDPEHPERTEGLLIDLGGNLRRHRIGASIEELYEAVRSEARGTELRKREGGGAAVRAEVEEVEVRELGNLFDRHAFSRVLAELLSRDDVPALAYRSNRSTDILFDYLNGAELPESNREVRELAELLNDRQQRLLDAWSWDKVAEMQQGQALSDGLPAPQRKLAERFRWAVWRNFNGAMSVAVPSKNSPLHDFWADGSLPLHNQPRLPLVSFYAQMRDLIAADQAMAPERIEMMQKDAIRAQRGWSVQPADPSSAEDVLLCWTRERVIEVYRGEVPMSGEDSLLQDSNLRPYFETGEIPLNGDLQAFWRQLADFLSRGDEAQALRAHLLAREVMRRRNGWDKDFPAATLEVEGLHAWFIESVLTRSYGVMSQTKGVAHELAKKIRRFAETRELPDARGRDDAGVFYAQLLRFAAGDDAGILSEGRVLIREVLRSQLGWNRPVAGLPRPVQDILDAFRERALADHAGQWPTVGPSAIPSRHPLRRFLEQGEEINVAEYRKELETFALLPEGRKIGDILDQAVWQQQAWNPDLSSSPAELQALHAWVRQRITRDFAGNAKLLGKPLRRFLESGELPDKLYGTFSMADFYENLLERSVGPDAGLRAEGRGLILAAVKVQRGWHQPVLGVSPEVQRVMDRFFDLVLEHYWGAPPTDDAQIQRGGRLRKLVDSRQWPEYKGTAVRQNWAAFAADLKAFFIHYGVPAAEADAWVDSAIPR